MPDYTAHVVLGESLTPVGQLRFTQAGLRQFSTFFYEAAWIDNPRKCRAAPHRFAGDHDYRAGL
jgi:serine/threonine-protein kinase HipA